MEDKGGISRRRLGPKPAAAASIMDIVDVDVASDVEWIAVLVTGFVGDVSTQQPTTRILYI